jgi:hypothetical protein
LGMQSEVREQLGSATDAEPRAVASGCKHSMLNLPEPSIHY